ncbi:MAG: DUF5011 domain-containing protein [Gammaproteobacteria bacterium]|nr:MAG: DUF5011 domain-containing protein [Gammaproteobacteria bacterium]
MDIKTLLFCKTTSFFKTISLLITSLLFSISCYALPVTGTEVPELSGLDQIVTDWMEQYGYNAATIAVAKDRKLVYQRGYGYQNKDLTQPILPHAKMRQATNSVTFTRRAIRQLVEDGLLSYDDLIYQVIDIEPWGGSYSDPRMFEITVRDLVDDRNCFIDSAPHTRTIGEQMGLGRFPTMAESMSYMWAYADTIIDNCTPGQERTIFSHFSMEVAALIIAKTANPTIDLTDPESVGTVLGEYVNTKIAQPIGATVLQANNRPEEAHPDEIWYESRFMCHPDWNRNWESGYDDISCAYACDFYQRPGSGTMVTNAHDFMLYLDNFWLNGEHKTNNISGGSWLMVGYGSLAGTTSVVSEEVWSDGENITFVVMANERNEAGGQDNSFNEIKDAVLNHLRDLRNNNQFPVSLNMFSDFDCFEYQSTLEEHENSGRAYSETVTEGQTCWGTFCYGGTTTTTWYALGTNEELGTNASTTVTMHEREPGVYALGVCPGPDKVAPVITLNGDNPMTVYKGSEFVDPGATANDNIDGDLTSEIIVNGYVDTSTIDSYALIYAVSDAAGNQTNAKRTVNVIAEPACQEFTDSASNHESAGRAYSVTETTGQTCWGTFCYGGTTTTTWYAEGSDENLGTDGNATVTLRTSENGYITGNCPTDPQPPVIESYQIAELNNYKAVVTGIASDPDGDISRIVLGLGVVTGIVCEGTTNFTCVLDYLENDITVGSPLNVSLVAWDSRNVRNEERVEFTITRPENQAPVINNTHASVSGNTVTITGNVNDADGNEDIKEVILYGEGGGIYCEGTANFACTVHDTPEGQYSWQVKAVDNAGNQSELENVNFEITGNSKPTIDTHQYTTDGLTVTFTGTASDPDGNLDRVVLALGAAGGVVCDGAANFTCTWTATQSGTYALGVVAIDTLDTYSDQAGPYQITLEEQVETCFTTTNQEHVDANRASLRYNILVYANGSNDYLGMTGDTTSLQETSDDVWEKVASCN